MIPSRRVFLSLFENVSRPTPEAIEQHVAYLRALDDAGDLVICGPFRDGSGGVVCFVAGSIEDADRIARSDPFVALGFKRYSLREIERADRSNHYLTEPTA